MQTVGAFEEVAQDLNIATARVLRAFAERASSYAVRVKDSSWLRYGLMAAQLAMSKEDIREVLVVYSLLYRGFELLGVDPVGSFEDIARQATQEIARYTVEFAQRDELDKSISAMKYVEGTDEDGFKFVRDW